MRKRFEDNLTEKIYDNVHGFISLTKEEKELLNTSYFQRLNFIKQLSLSHFVFPGAVHTRFSHSLGVLHIVEKMIQRLKAKNCTFFNDYKNHQITRLAALLHDIGHYPLSHTIESSYKEYQLAEQQQSLKSLLVENTGITEQPSLKKICDSNDIQTFLMHQEKVNQSELHHETFAKYILQSGPFKENFKKLFHEINDSDIEIIASLIVGQPVNKEYFIASDLINSRLDADQMDYMKRDTINTGILASVDIDFIIKNMIPYEIEINGIKTERVAFKEEALQVIEQFILAKYYWYSNILYYDKTYIVNNIAKRLYTKLLIDKKIDEEYSTVNNFKSLLENSPNKFFFFNDDYFWKQIHKILSSKQKNMTYKLANMLVNRQFPEVEKQNFFNKHFSNSNLINSHCQITGNETEYKKAKACFENKIKELNKKEKKFLYGTPISEKIVCDDIFIQVSDKLKCKKIIDMPNHFFQQFITNENSENNTDEQNTARKTLKIFRVYNFENILS